MNRRKIGMTILACCLIFGNLPATSGAEGAERTENIPVEVMAEAKNPLELTGEFPVIATAKNPAEFKTELHKAMEQFRERFAIEYTGTGAEEIAKALWREAQEDPAKSKGEYFFGMEYWQWAEDVLPELVSKDGKQVFRFLATPLYTLEESEEFEKLLDAFLLNLTDVGMSAFEKIRAVHDYIAVTKYMYYSPNNPYLFLREGRGSLTNYSLLAYRMLEKLGFDVRMVADETMWTKWLKVRVDGQWYNLDIFGDEPKDEERDQDSRSVVRNYLLVSDQKLNATHDKQHPRIAYPAATSTRFDGENNGVKKTYSASELEELLYKGAELRTDREFEKIATRLKTPHIRKDRPNSFTVRFNQNVDRTAFSKIKLYRMDKGRKVEVSFTPSVNGSVVTLTAGGNGVFANGIYYVSVEKGIRTPSGRELKKSYYRKIKVDWTGN